MSRKKTFPQRRRRSPKVTPEMAARIKHKLGLGLMQHDIASEEGINQGRVSEINTGKLFSEVRPASPD